MRQEEYWVGLLSFPSHRAKRWGTTSVSDPPRVVSHAPPPLHKVAQERRQCNTLQNHDKTLGTGSMHAMVIRESWCPIPPFEKQRAGVCFGASACEGLSARGRRDANRQLPVTSCSLHPSTRMHPLTWPGRKLTVSYLDSEAKIIPVIDTSPRGRGGSGRGGGARKVLGGRETRGPSRRCPGQGCADYKV